MALVVKSGVAGGFAPKSPKRIFPLAVLLLGLLSACVNGTHDVDAGAQDAALSDASASGDAAVVDSHFEPVNNCQEINASECFANIDCPSAQRCQNMGSVEDQVPCCVDGLRGEDPVGSVCSMQDGELTCASGLCIDGSAGTFCSDVCQDEGDCPAQMQLCQPVFYSGSNEQWCFPH